MIKYLLTRWRHEVRLYVLRLKTYKQVCESPSTLEIEPFYTRILGNIVHKNSSEHDKVTSQ